MNNLPAQVRRQRGFTLLEVIVALTICGFVLGGLFSLVAGSKQLTWRARDSLVHATRVRAATNFALLHNEINEVQPVLQDQRYQVLGLEIPEDPERKTELMVHALQPFEIHIEDDGRVIFGKRWVQLEVSR